MNILPKIANVAKRLSNRKKERKLSIFQQFCELKVYNVGVLKGDFSSLCNPIVRKSKDIL